jgi:hypothetical protein
MRYLVTLLWGDTLSFNIKHQLTHILYYFLFIATKFDRNSINAQKLSDERHGPFKPANAYQAEMRTRPNFRPSAAISSLAGSEMGDTKSFRAVRAYQNEFSKRRDEILTDIAKNG